MLIMKINLLLSICFVLIVMSCTNSSESDLIDTIDPVVTVSYSDQIKPIFENNCVGCHSNPAISGASMPLTTYEEVKFATQNTDLINRIELQPGEAGFMPTGRSRLPQNKIDLIIQWRDEGFLE